MCTFGSSNDSSFARPVVPCSACEWVNKNHGVQCLFCSQWAFMHMLLLCIPLCISWAFSLLLKVKRSSICIAHRRKHVHASNALSSLTRAACRTAPCAACRHRLAQWPARQPQSAVPRSPPSVTHANELLLILPAHRE